MDVVRVGDLVRWRNPLYIIENGREEKVGAWHYAIVTEITKELLPFSKTESAHIGLMLLGMSYPGKRIELPVEMFFEVEQP